MRPGQILYDFLAVRDPVEPVDVIVGFGHFDERVPQRCAELWHKGVAPIILFSGRNGRATPDDVDCEAEWFAHIAERQWSVPREAIRLETQSTNALENVRKCNEIVEPQLTRWIAVANPCMQRRISLALSQQTDRAVISSPPNGNLEDEMAIYLAAGEDFATWMTGEIERLERYAAMGHIDRCSVPVDVLGAYHQLVKENETRSR